MNFLTFMIKRLFSPSSPFRPTTWAIDLFFRPFGLEGPFWVGLRPGAQLGRGPFWTVTQYRGIWVTTNFTWSKQKTRTFLKGTIQGLSLKPCESKSSPPKADRCSFKVRSRGVKYTCGYHSHAEAFVQPAFLAPVPVLFVYRATRLGEAIVAQLGANASFEKPFAAFTSQDAIMSASSAVPAHKAASPRHMRLSGVSVGQHTAEKYSITSRITIMPR